MITRPYKYQREGAAAIERFGGRALLADEMGLGKSIQALLWAWRNPEAFPVVVVCPATLKWNWQREYQIHFELFAAVLEGTKPRDLSEHDRVIVNYDVLGPTRHGPGWLLTLKALKPKLIIVDESHYIKDGRSRRTRWVRELCQGVPHVIALTGTPVLNKPAEVWTTLNLLLPSQFKYFRPFGQYFCDERVRPWGITYDGASHVKELNRILRETCMIRRLKADVLKELPPKVRTVIPLDMDRPAEYERARKEFLAWLAKKSKEKAAKAMKAEQLVKIGYLKRLAAELKLRQALAWVEEFLEGGKKLILFAIHRNIISAFSEKFAKVCVVVDGTVTGEKRQRAVDAFQRNPRVKLFIGNVKAAGVGITLTAADTVALAETPWTPGECVQCEDRAHRVGQRAVVSVFYLVARNSIEEHLAAVVQEKAKVIAAVVDGGEAATELNILDILLKKLEGKR